ncbi:voltage-dependent calcium channel subunit alpha-2/delta-3-like [Convolutriloba macropyga]|uniref:voltage-dependent calcium channel subunit alpha-2/delta-3-like n=1 Tax=Convolutriloba macropyga TaxID=536237 RepID=UPI003F52610A
MKCQFVPLLAAYSCINRHHPHPPHPNRHYSSLLSFNFTLFILLILSLLTRGVLPSNTKDHEISKDEVKELGQELARYFGTTLGDLLGADKYERILYRRNPLVYKIDGVKMVREFAAEMQKMLSAKITAIENIANQTEDANMKHKYDKNLKFDYYNANFLNKYKYYKDENGTVVKELKKDSREMELKPSEHFQDTLINLTHSTLQVPVNIFKKDPDVVNGIYVTESLNKVFQDNHNKDPTLTWQYFGSSTGFFRNYPGVEWGDSESGVDEYDARERSWYLQASHSPKDIVILIDSSGSMTGSREFVANNAVNVIIKTLLDDDFFNILTFAEETAYLEECFNGHLVQANSDNKQIMMNNLHNREGSVGIANFDAALRTAFELLQNKSEAGSQCNQAIMLLTDGAVDNFQHIFEHYNKKRMIRVFTYIIGRDVKNSDPVKWMACNNKGWYAQIATLADVKINVMVRLKNRATIENILTAPSAPPPLCHFLGLRLMTTVSTPAFDNVVERANEGILLGVAGVDVPINEMNTYTPSYRLGLNGYTFSITNNGYIMNHPELRPKYVNHKGEETDKPNYNSVDMSEVELQDRRHNYTYDNGTAVWIEDGKLVHVVETLRSRMVDGHIGGYTLDDVIYRMSAWDRIDIRDMNYYFTPLEKTPFRLAIAIQREFGMYNFSLQSGMNDKREQREAMDEKHDKIRLDSCNTLSVCAVYCMMNESTSKHLEQIEAVANEIENSRKNEQLHVVCNKDAVRAVLEDAVVSKEFSDEFWDVNEAKLRNAGVEEVFVGTRSGFIRVKQMGTKELILKTEEPTLGAEFFQMASSIYSLMKRNGALVIWIPTERDIYEVATGHKDVVAVAKLVFAGKTPAPEKQSENQYPYNSNYNPYNTGNTWSSYSRGDTYQSQDTQNIFDPSTGYYNRQKRSGWPDDIRFFGQDGSNNPNYAENIYTASEQKEKRKNDTVPTRNVYVGSVQYEKDHEGKYPELDEDSFYYKYHMNNEVALAGSVGMYVSLDSVEKEFRDIMGRSYSKTGSQHKEAIFTQQKNCLESNLIDCYVLDHNAFVVMSEHKNHYSKFFGEIDGNAMRSMESLGLFKKKMLYKDLEGTNLVLVAVINAPNCECDREPFQLMKSRKEYASTLERCDRMLFQKHRSRPPMCQNYHDKEDSKHCGRSQRVELTSVLLLISIIFHSARHLSWTCSIASASAT